MKFQDISTFYQAIADKDPEAKALLLFRDWFYQICNFDPRTGKAIDTGLTQFLNQIPPYHQEIPSKPKDHLYRIIEHVGMRTPQKRQPALQHLLENPKQSIQREYQHKPPSRVTEIDSNCVQWLVKQPGQTVREKANISRTIRAVHRRMSRDTSENQLLKTFIRRLGKAMEKREQTFPEIINSPEGRLHLKMRRWLFEPQNQEIGEWRNLPPNNSLLQDQYYRAIWQGWKQLLFLNQDIEYDTEHWARYQLSRLFWQLIHTLRQDYNYLFLQIPLSIQYSTAQILPFGSKTYTTIYGYLSEDEHFVAQLNNNDGSWWISFLPECKNWNAILSPVVKDPSLLSFCYQKDDDKNLQTYPILSPDIDIVKEIIGKIIPSRKRRGRQYHPKEELQESELVAIDLFSIQPTFSSDILQSASFPERLIIQDLSSEDKHFTLSCPDQQAYLFKEDIKTITSLDIFNSNSKYIRDQISEYSAKRLREYFPKGQHFSTIIPDITSDFALQPLRQAFNQIGRNTPLPRSIATMLDYQYSPNRKEEIEANSSYLVLDFIFDQLVLISVVSRYSKDLKCRLPESQGIYWERHPPLQYPSETLVTRLIRCLKEHNIERAEFIVEKFGVQWLFENPLVWRENGNWQVIPPQIRGKIYTELFQKPFSLNPNDWDIPNLHGQRSIQVLSIQQEIELQIDNRHFQIISPKIDLTQGGLIALQKEKELTNNQTLWQDYLPKLTIRTMSTKGVRDTLLVNNRKMIPSFGKEISIPIRDKFTLPAGADEYRFPLYQGNGDATSFYIAKLNHHSFPLQEDYTCQLILSYKYGANDAYSLYFEPESKDAPFKRILVEWDQDENPHRSNVFPNFPERTTWQSLRKHPSKKGFVDIIEQLNDAPRYYKTRLDAKNFQDKHWGGINYYLSICFQHDRHLESDDIPPDIKTTLKTSWYAWAFYIYNQPSTPDFLKSEVLSHLCRAPQDLPQEIIRELLDFSKRFNRNTSYPQRQKYFTPLYFALGNLKKDWQQELAVNIYDADINYLDRIFFFHKASWRSENFIFNLYQQIDFTGIRSIFNDCLKAFEKFEKEKSYYSQNTAYQATELLLALLRLRSLDDPKLNKLFSPRNKNIQKIIEISSLLSTEIDTYNQNILPQIKEISQIRAKIKDNKRKLSHQKRQSKKTYLPSHVQQNIRTEIEQLNREIKQLESNLPQKTPRLIKTNVSLNVDANMSISMNKLIFILQVNLLGDNLSKMIQIAEIKEDE